MEKPPGYYERVDEAYRREQELPNQDVLPFLRAGFRQVEKSTEGRTYGIFFSLPPWVESHSIPLSLQETNAIPILNRRHPHAVEKDFRRCVREILSEAKDASDVVYEQESSYGSEAQQMQNLAVSEAAIAVLQMQVVELQAEISRLNEMLAIVENGQNPMDKLHAGDLVAKVLSLSSTELSGKDYFGTLFVDAGEASLEYLQTILSEKQAVVQKKTAVSSAFASSMEKCETARQRHNEELERELDKVMEYFVKKQDASVRESCVLHDWCAEFGETDYFGTLLQYEPNWEAAFQDLDYGLGMTPLKCMQPEAPSLQTATGGLKLY